MEYALSLLPVTVFLVGLFLFDNFKLVRKSLLALSLLWGIVSAVLAYYINSSLSGIYAQEISTFSRYIAPFTEEILKALLIIGMISKRKIGFTVDAVIYGFAVGTGFALSENLVYLYQLAEVHNFTIWIVRGFGTALMHGGATAIMATLLLTGVQRNKPVSVSVWPGLAAAIALHGLFNHFLLEPVFQTFALIIILPVTFYLIFRQSNLMMQNWLEIEFSSEIEMLRMIKQGNFKATKSGQYLASLKDYFKPETIVDLYAYIRLYLELSIAAKRNLMLKESGYEAVMDEDILHDLNELKQLRKMIGKAGEMAIQPVVRMKHRELWKLNQLKR
jgi:RsiW-degrading membrane proteinase PrsW (M82 family)